MKLLREIKTKIGIPGEYLNEPKVEYLKQKMKLFNYGKIIDISKDIIKTTVFDIEGENLSIENMDLASIVVSGKITTLRFNYV